MLYKEPDTLYRNINEPAVGYKGLIDFTKYPNMENAYKCMEKILGHSDFILTSGCENAIRIVLEVEKPKSLTWCKPSWGMMDSFVEMFGIKPYCQYFDYKNGVFIEKINKNAEAHYGCEGINNYISYKKHSGQLFNLDICDITYFEPSELHKFSPSYHQVYVGSFDKWWGCGLRLGFIIFDDAKKDLYYLHRERYLNTGAIEALFYYSNHKFIYPEKNTQLKDFEIVCKNKIYTTYKGHCDLYGARNFTVDGESFFRLNNGEL